MLTPPPRKCTVRPHAVIVGTRYYLIPRDVNADRQCRQFRFDRIVEVYATIQVFERDLDFDVKGYNAQAFGSFSSEVKQCPVPWRFAPCAASAAREYVFHPTLQWSNPTARKYLTRCRTSRRFHI